MSTHSALSSLEIYPVWTSAGEDRNCKTRHAVDMYVYVGVLSPIIMDMS